jgi:hypothetical protein
MAPLDALTEARIRSLEIVVAWLIGRTMLLGNGANDAPDEFKQFSEDAMRNTYILELAEKIQEAQEDA